MAMGPIGRRWAIAPVLLNFSKFCFQIITDNMLENNNSSKKKKKNWPIFNQLIPLKVVRFFCITITYT